MKLLDVHILVYAHREDSERHREMKEWLETALDQPEGVAVSELVLSGCLRVITHPKVFKQPTPLPVALQFIESLRNLDNLRVIAPGEKHWAIFVGLCRKTEVRGNLVPDAYHAALAVETGCEWITLDRGFARFQGLRMVHPLD
jgi:toxin-antitoxin system PIN domain toxin